MVAGQAGCWLTITVFGALFAGLWLDAQFGLKGPFTVGLVTISVPISLYIVVRIVLRLVAAIQPETNENEYTSHQSKEGDL
jgi:hypothetical protein